MKKILYYFIIFIILFNLVGCTENQKYQKEIINHLIDEYSIQTEFDTGTIIKPPNGNIQQTSKLDRNDIDRLLKYFNSLKVIETNKAMKIENKLPIKRIMVSGSNGYEEIDICFFNENHFQIIVTTLEEKYDEGNKITKFENNHLIYNYKIIDETINFTLLNEIYE